MSIFLLMNSHYHELSLPPSCLNAVEINGSWTDKEKKECDEFINENRDETVRKLLANPTDNIVRWAILVTSCISTVLFVI